MNLRRLSFPSITAKNCIWVLHRTHPDVSLSRWSLALCHQSLAFRARLYAKPCRERSAWGGGGCIRAYVWGILRTYTANGWDVHGRETRDKTLRTFSWEGGQAQVHRKWFYFVMRHLIYQAAYHFRKLKIKEWLFSLTDEREDPEEETAEVAQKKKKR